MRDLQLGSNILVSINRQGTGSAHGTSHLASISANGRYVVFISSADDLTPNDTNGLDDIFVRDLVSGDFNDAVDVFTVAIEPTTPVTDTPVIRLTGAVQQSGLTTIHWTATPGHSYRDEYKGSLTASTWQDLPGVVMIVGPTAWISDASGVNAQQRFYRVRLVE